MTQIEFEKKFGEQAEKFGIAEAVRKSGKDYEFQSFMLAMSKFVAEESDKELDKACKWIDERVHGGVHPCSAFNVSKEFRNAMMGEK